jgi:uncharacterized delta-60 repeat protein
MSRPLLLIVLAALAVPASTFAQAGTLDTSFSGDGKQMTNMSSGFDGAYDVVVQADGKIVAAGEVDGLGGRLGLVRHTADGSLDPTFSGDGKVLTNLTGGADFGLDVALQPDQKIVVTGGIGGSGGRCGVYRFNPDGSLDPTFSGDGRQAINFSPGWDSCFDLQIQGDGKIVTGGVAAGQGTRATLLRLDPDGSLDPTFTGDGTLVRNYTSRTDYFEAIALQADGKIVVAGTADWDRSGSRLLVARFEADGTADPTFSGDGLILANFPTAYDGAYALGVQPADQHIVVGGQAGESLTLLRYRPDGTLDPAFSGDGRVVTEVAPTLDYAEDLEVQADGKIVAGGSASYFRPDSKFLLVRYDAAGLLDPSFSGDGELVINFTNGADEGYGIALQPADGKIVVAGTASGSKGRFALARVNAS